MLIDIAVEELSHLEVIGMLAKMHLKPLKDSFKEAPPTRSRRSPAGAG